MMDVQPESAGAPGLHSADTRRYPIGPFRRPAALAPAERSTAIEEIAHLPRDVRRAVERLGEAQLDTPYREGGWTVRQVVHHLADSHTNAYVRLKLALTEDHPTIKPYDEARWAETDDARSLPVETSLCLLEGLHQRWAAAFRSLDDAAFARTINHPELGTVRVDQLLAMYAWHGRHHLAHITRAING